MRILLAADQYPEYHNGAGAFTERLATGLAGRGHTVTVIYPSPHGHRVSRLRDGLCDQRLSSVALPRGRGLRVCTPHSARRAADAILADTPVDLVHVQSHLPVGRAFLAAARERGIPVVATNHFMPENLLPHIPVTDGARRCLADWAWRDLAQVFQQAQLITTPTGRAAELLAARTGLANIEVISNGVDLDHYAPAGNADSEGDDNPIVLFVGRLEPEKRVDDLFQAFAALPADLPARLVYIGTGSRLGALRRLAQHHHIDGRVEFWGNVSAQRLRRAYTECAVFCAPGIAELQSLVTLEAVASGAPVVAADAVALPHLVHHGRNGFRYPPAQPELLTSHLATLLTDPTLRRRMSAESRAVAEHHDVELTLNAYLDCYRRVATLTGRQPVTPAETVLAA